MKKKLAFLLIALLLSDGICKLTKVFPQYKIMNTSMEQIDCAVVKAAETSEDKEAAGDIEHKSADEPKKDTGAEDLAESGKLSESKETEVSGKEKRELTEKEEGELPEAPETEEELPFDEKTDNTEDEKEEEAQENIDVYHVSFPTDSRAYLDPDNLSGKGQIFSEDFRIENYGNTDISIKIKNIEVYYRTIEEVYELSETEVTDRTSDIKKLNVDIVWKNEKDNMEKVLNIAEGTFDECVLDLKASKYDEVGSFIEFDEGSVGLFYFTGTVNSNPELVWEDGEVTISFGYEIVKTEEESEQMPEENQEAEEKQENQEEETEHEQTDNCEEERQSEEETEEFPLTM